MAQMEFIPRSGLDRQEGRLAASEVGLVDDRVPKNADAGDLDLGDVARAHPERRGALGAHAAGRTGDDDVAGQSGRIVEQ